MDSQRTTPGQPGSPILRTVEVSEPGALLQVWRIDLTEDAKRALTVTREQWEAVSQPAVPRPKLK